MGRIGQKAWNKGKENPLAKNLPQAFKKGSPPWNKGLKKGQHPGIRSGDKINTWKGGITPDHEYQRRTREYALWRKAVFERDDYTCQMCGKRGDELHADHIKPFALYPEFRLSIDNGRTLCVPCHRSTPSYGRFLMVREQIMTPSQQKLYAEAKSLLGKHIGLDPHVPDDVNCAEAVSYVLQNVGVKGIPASGFAGTANLYEFMLANPTVFKLIPQPEQGAIIVSPTGYGNGTVVGHTGILGGFGVQYPNEYGIMSNNSDNGLWQEKWNLLTWWENYGIKGRLPLALFRLL